ncbi:MAG: DMT family transporter [Rhodobacteraceae bacterium]|nr:DMT family transporter [Paracoccaceae bacterium]
MTDSQTPPTDPGPTAIPVARTARNTPQGLIWALVSVMGASLMTLAVRGVTLEVDSRMAVLFRAGITSILIALVLILFAGARRQMRFSRPGQHLLRGALIGVSTNLGFYTLAHIPLGTATVLFFMGPIFAAAMGVIMHGESIGPRRIAAIAAGFIGALIIIRPGFEAFHPAMLAALGSSLLFAMALTMSRNLANADGALSTYFSSVVITVLVTLPVALPVWEMPTKWITWGSVAALVAFSTLRGIADIQAYRHADAALIAPVSYLRLVVIGFAAWLLFGETIDNATLTGAAVIIGATLYIARRESRARSRGG